MTNKDNYVLKGGVSKNRIDTESILNNLSEGSEIALDLVEGLGESNNIELLANGYEEEINNLKQKEIYKKLEKEKKLEIERIKQEEKILKQQQREIKKIYNALDNRRTNITKIDTGNRRRSKAEFREEDNKTEPIIKKRNNIDSEDEKINRRAEILYGNTEYNQYWKDVSNKTKKQDIGEITKQPEIKPLPDISNPEKMFFKNGTLADMPVAKQYDLTKYNQNQKQSSVEKTLKHLPDYMKHNPLNIIAVDYIHNPTVRELGVRRTGREAAENLYMSKAEHYLNTPYARQFLIFNNYKEVAEELQPYLKNKIIQQLGEDKLETTKGIYIDAESESSKKLAEVLADNTDFKNILIENRHRLKYNIPFDASIRFVDSNFAYALGNADLKDIRKNKNGDIELIVADTYDFNPGSDSDLVQTGRERQLSGEIIPYFIIYHVIISKNSKIRSKKK